MASAMTKQRTQRRVRAPSGQLLKAQNQAEDLSNPFAVAVSNQNGDGVDGSSQP
jgi:hypothetical protein